MPYEQYRRYSLLTLVLVAAAFEPEALRIHGLGTVKAFYTICDQSIILWDLKVAENTIFTKFFFIACHEMFYKFSVSTKLLPFVKLPQDFQNCCPKTTEHQFRTFAQHNPSFLYLISVGKQL